MPAGWHRGKRTIDSLSLMQVPQPTLYKKEYVHIAVKLCRLGATLPQVADVLAPPFIARQPSTQPFVLPEARQEAFDTRVKRSLAEKAIGFCYIARRRRC